MEAVGVVKIRIVGEVLQRDKRTDFSFLGVNPKTNGIEPWGNAINNTELHFLTPTPFNFFRNNWGDAQEQCSFDLINLMLY